MNPIREILSILINPLPILYMLLLAAFVFYIIRRKRVWKIFVIITGTWFLIISTAPIPNALISSLENRYPPITAETLQTLTTPCDIIVLGGGHSDDKNLSPNNQLSTTALGRLVEGIRIQKMIPGSRLILSGYSGRSEIPQALVLYNTALLLGTDPSSMAVQTSPVNTRMEAEEYSKIFGNSNTLILVTSAVHMPRAMMHLKKEGLSPIPAPANFIIKHGSRKNPWRWIPNAGNISKMETAVHEYVGMLVGSFALP